MISAPGCRLRTHRRGGHRLDAGAAPAALAGALGAVPVLATGVLATLRMIKDADEIEVLRAAGAAIDRCTPGCPSCSSPAAPRRKWPRTSPRPSWPRGIRRRPSSSSVGAQRRRPAPRVSDRVLQPGDIVVVDIGGPVEPG